LYGFPDAGFVIFPRIEQDIVTGGYIVISSRNAGILLCAAPLQGNHKSQTQQYDIIEYLLQVFDKDAKLDEILIYSKRMK